MNDYWLKYYRCCTSSCTTFNVIDFAEYIKGVQWNISSWDYRGITVIPYKIKIAYKWSIGLGTLAHFISAVKLHCEEDKIDPSYRQKNCWITISRSAIYFIEAYWCIVMQRAITLRCKNVTGDEYIRLGNMKRAQSRKKVGDDCDAWISSVTVKWVTKQRRF